MKKLLATFALSAALVVPQIVMAQDHDRRDDHDRQDDRGFYDKHHKDYHKWDSHEDRAWHIYEEQHHRKYVDFNAARESDRQAYWAWRHNHNDSLLKIDIR
ncbi:MAG TPA: hypothetical protein VK604_16140 [Bryobacteraceae bacterium]|nr:hypothetical protein [Bryobacteraceae bacterium]